MQHRSATSDTNCQCRETYRPSVCITCAPRAARMDVLEKNGKCQGKAHVHNGTHQTARQTKQPQKQKAIAPYLNEATCGACMTRTPPDERGPQSKLQGGDLKACTLLGQNAPRSSSPRVCLACLAHEKRAIATHAEAMCNKMHEQEGIRTRA